MALTSTDIVNQALEMMGGNQPLVTGLWPNFNTANPTGVAANLLYGAAVATVGRQFGWDFSRNTVALTVSGNTAPFPWSVEYLYPANGVQVWQLIPPTLTDRNNPLPTNWVVANAVVSGTQAKVIQADLASALAVYNNNPTEATWDALFRESVVRLLANGFAMAIAGKPDTALEMLQSGGAFEALGEQRDG